MHLASRFTPRRDLRPKRRWGYTGRARPRTLLRIASRHGCVADQISGLPWNYSELRETLLTLFQFLSLLSVQNGKSLETETVLSIQKLFEKADSLCKQSC